MARRVLMGVPGPSRPRRAPWWTWVLAGAAAVLGIEGLMVLAIVRGPVVVLVPRTTVALAVRSTEVKAGAPLLRENRELLRRSVRAALLPVLNNASLSVDGVTLTIPSHDRQRLERELSTLALKTARQLLVKPSAADERVVEHVVAQRLARSPIRVEWGPLSFQVHVLVRQAP